MLKLFGLRGTYWIESGRNDVPAHKLADRHYSRRIPGSKDFVGPGEVLILVGSERLWVSRYCRWRRRDGLDGVECLIFLNESEILSSELVKEAVELTMLRFRDKLIDFHLC